MLNLQLIFFPSKLLQRGHILLRIAVSEWGGGVAPPALGTMVDPVPAAGTDHVLALTGENLPRGRLQADWTLQVGLLLLEILR